MKFGTEGWRGIIGKEMTFNNIAKISQATVNYLKRKGEKEVTIGYDNRFLSDKFAILSAKIFMSNSFNTRLVNSSITSPNLCYYIKSSSPHTGIMITASHNPPEYNGIKIKAPYGGPAPDWFNSEIQSELMHIMQEKGLNFCDKGLYYHNLQPFAEKDLVDLKIVYLDYLRRTVDLNSIQRANLKIIFDSMHGTAGQYLTKLFPGAKIVIIRSKRDPLFSNSTPEPIERNLIVLKRTVLAEKAVAGIAFDGDGDRIGVIDDTGRYLPPHIVFPLLLYYFVRYRQLKGEVIQTISLGYLSERIAKKYNLDFEEVPVGFKYITEKLLSKKEKIILAGEESGGYFTYNSEILDRDGLLCALTLLEMISATGKKLSILVKELEKEFGKSYFSRYDLYISPVEKETFCDTILKKIPQKIHNKKIVQIKTFDGIKIILNDDSWVLIRPSGTEPLVRIYAEAHAKQEVIKMINFGRKLTTECVV